jgi:hypothetical protein
MKTKWLGDTLISFQKLALCLNEKEYNDALNDLNVEKQGRRRWVNDGANATTHFFDGGECGAVVVCMKDYEFVDPIMVAGLLVHESVHVWQNYCDRIGEEFPSSEFEAYAIQTISQKLFGAFRDKVCKQ